LSEFVLDASVALAWFFADEAEPYATAVLDRMLESAAFAPAIWPLEVANALVVAERRQRATVAQSARALEQLMYLPIHPDEVLTPGRLGLVISLARAQNLSSYDAAYLELAIRRGVPLASLDDRLIVAARNCGVSILA
jgi:predicted nucleic acid-binding protein